MNDAARRMSEGLLFTDQYQLTMAQLYFRSGMHEMPVQFEYYFRHYPDYGQHQAGYGINAGLEWLVRWMQATHVSREDITYLRGQRGVTGKPLFSDEFLQWLTGNGHFGAITLRAIPEGRVVHANVPLVSVQGPMAMAQILETPLLNKLNYQILIATKAARLRQACGQGLLLEFGMRRAQDLGANAGARAALIGGADFSSNVGLSHTLGFQPKGTHAHSMIQAFMARGEGELGAFRAYAELYPDDCVLLVDTIDTLESGVPNAIRVFEELRQKGHRPLGIRLDSGDLAYLSIQASKMLDQAGFPDATIVLSNELDELNIWQIVTQIGEEAPRYDADADKVIGRLSYGVGTRMITSHGEPALSGVYKLVAICDKGDWVPAIKISESVVKTLNPGTKKVWRLYDQRGYATADVLSLAVENLHEMDSLTLHHPTDHTKYRTLRAGDVSQVEPLQVDIQIDGRLVYEYPDMATIRAQRLADVERLDPGVKRLINPHIYHVSVTKALWDLKEGLIHAAKGTVNQPQTGGS